LLHISDCHEQRQGAFDMNHLLTKRDLLRSAALAAITAAATKSGSVQAQTSTARPADAAGHEDER
jgi:hypothetical protein